MHSGTRACLIAFYTFLRKASLLPRSVSSTDAKYLCHGDLEHDTSASIVYITIRHTKTIQFGQRVLRIPISGHSDSPLCPLVAIRNMLDNLPSVQPQTASLFSYCTKTGAITCIAYNSFIKHLKHVLSLAGLPPKDYSGHSFRRGGCSFAFKLGIPPLLIKLRGDWRSNAYERYITVTDNMNVKVAKAISIAASTM